MLTKIGTGSSLSAAAALIVIALVVGCNSNPSGEASSESNEANREGVWTIGMSQCNLNEPWRVQMNADIKQAAESNPKLSVVFKDAQNDSLKQRAHMEEFVAADVDLILVSPKESQPLTQPIAKAYQAQIPVIVLDRAVLGDQYTTFIGADNEAIGLAAGQWIADHIEADANIVELKGLMTSAPAQDRHNGFREGLAGKGEIVFEADMKWLEPDARKEMDSALARFEEIDVVYAHNDPGAHGAYLAAKAAGREKEILFVGIDALPHEGVAYVEQGILDATFQYPTGGAKAIEVAEQILAGEEPPKQIRLPSRVFTQENIEQGGMALE